MPEPSLILGIGLALGLAVPAAAAEVDEVPFSVRVNHAVDRGCAWLLAQQEPEGGFGTWDQVHPIGRTSLTLLTVLHGGVPPSEPRVAKGIDYLIRHLRERRGTREGGEAAYRSTYETGITLMLLYDLGPDPRYAEEMPPLADFLVATVRQDVKMWGYPEGTPDISNSQYAMLGLRAAWRRGLKVKGMREALATGLEGVLRAQRKDGGIAYRPENFSRGSMTVAGLAMIHICEEILKGYGPAQRDLREARRVVKEAQEWLDEHFTVQHHPEGNALSSSNLHYYLYGLERYAAFYELEEIAGRDWYEEGARHLLATQKAGGEWGSIEETCFAILFLEKASLSVPAERGQEWSAALEAEAAAAEAAPPRPDDAIPFLREWLIAGPFQSSPETDDALLIDHVKEARVRPARGRKAGDGKWELHQAEEDRIDLVKATGSTGAGADVVDLAAAYAATWLKADAPREAVLWLDSDDGVRVFLGGERIFEDHHHDGKDGMRVPLTVPAGETCLMLKVENVNYGWNFRARLSDPEGRRLEGVEVDARGR